MRVAIITTYQPETHYSRYLFEGLNTVKGRDDNIVLYVDINTDNEKIHDKNIKLVWDSGFESINKIIFQLRRDNINLVHLQHEFNMYGGIKGVFYFLRLLFALRDYKRIVTFHAVINVKEIDDNFLTIFSLKKFKKLKFFIRLAFKWFYKISIKFSDKIIVHSLCLKNTLIKAYSVSGRKVDVVPIGISPLCKGKALDVVIESKWIGKVKNKKFILFFGYLLERKGLDVLIDAFIDVSERLKTYKLVIAGGELKGHEDYAQSLYKKVGEKNMEDKIIFTNFLSENEIKWLYDNCAFVALPYTYSISVSLPLSMAFGAGKPVLASDVESFKYEIKDGYSGLFFKNGDRQDLKNKICYLCEKDELLEKLKIGVTKEREKRSWANIGQQTLQIYKQT